ncbi:ABC transporter permease subunit [Streptomyces sp. P9(2023)]|uniref:ABC transporter permease subunit n=1 Tax=Streptomyces sp. P9(2023) TaxID=3064394 RepID=UPI0028F43097|nr:ABC transporter permease subunit [Streptomyces sp. P9(2023)]MDT9693268.1 ABC transporter permease subunit [Streptomyces sp. P9(2023)]
MTTISLKGPYWVTVRQHRRVLILAAAAVALSLVSMAWLRYWDSRTVGLDRDHGHALLRAGMDWAATGFLFVPLLVGGFVAGPLIARELESGTYKLALTQSVTPSRWLASKLLVAGAVTLAGTLVLVGTFRLGWGNVGSSYRFQWYDQGVFEASGPVLVAYGLLALAVGAVLGQLIRRTVVAMAAAGAVTGVVLLVLSTLRWDWLAVRTATAPFTSGNSAMALVPADARLADTGLLTSSGERLEGWFCAEPFDPALCRDDVTVASYFADYQPASYYWPLQLIETGIVLALAALALLAAFRILRTRHG